MRPVPDKAVEAQARRLYPGPWEDPAETKWQRDMRAYSRKGLEAAYKAIIEDVVEELRNIEAAYLGYDPDTDGDRYFDAADAIVRWAEIET